MVTALRAITSRRGDPHRAAERYRAAHYIAGRGMLSRVEWPRGDQRRLASFIVSRSTMVLARAR